MTSTSRGRLKRYILLFIIVLVLLLGVIIGLRTLRKVPTEPEALFYRALHENFVETGVSCIITDTSGTSSSRQAISLDLPSKQNLRSVIQATTPERSVEIEEMVTGKGDYVRYNSFHSTARTASESSPDFSKALHVWSKADPSQESKSMFGRTALGNCIVPLAHVSNQQATELTAELHKGNIFVTNMTRSKVQKLGPQQVRVYDVTVQPQPYVAFMKQVAKVYGLKDLDDIKTASFAARTPERMQFFIDQKSGRLTKIEYTARHYTVNFSGYGEIPKITAPATYITSDELQKRLTQ